jgi:phospholipase C
MDGFVEANEQGGPLGDGARALFYYDQRDLPFYYQLASTFAIADHWHCSLLGPTFPNRMYTYAATSFGRTTNDFPENLETSHPFPQKDASVLDELEKRHVSWALYGTSGALTVHGPAALYRWGRRVQKFQSDFFAEAKAGTLPQVVYLDVDISADPVKNPNEHPPADIQVGQKFVSDAVHALFASPQWSKTALFFTYDEHGGYYDHVPPPPACPPDSLTPINQSGAFDRYGVRVPFVLVSPYARKGFVSHKIYDHASIVRFIQAKHRMPALTNRDANADIPTDMFDFAAPPFSTPPVIPEPAIDQADLDYCIKTHPK